jgi:arylformamidase
MKKILNKPLDISWPIAADMTTYKDRDDIELTNTGMRCNYHVGTHVDAPAHFIAGGKTIDQIAVDKFYGMCRVLDMTHKEEKITREDLVDCVILEHEIIILKTYNSDLPATGPFVFDFVYLDASGAQYLAEKNIKAVGIDYLGIERSQPDHATHKTLLAKEILIIEGLRLAGVISGEYNFFCFPLFVQGADAAPARAVLESR